MVRLVGPSLKLTTSALKNFSLTGAASTQLTGPPAPSSQLPLVAPVQVRTLAPVIWTLMSLAPGMMVPLVGRESGMDGKAPSVRVPPPVTPPPAVRTV